MHGSLCGYRRRGWQIRIDTQKAPAGEAGAGSGELDLSVIADCNIIVNPVPLGYI